MQILFLSPWFPFPHNNGSKLRIFNLLQTISQRHDVQLITFAETNEDTSGAHELKKLCSKVEIVEWKEYEPHRAKSVYALFSKEPRSITDTFSSSMKFLIEESIKRTPPHLIIASQLRTATYAPFFRGIPALFEEVELGALRDKKLQARSLPQKARHALTWIKFAPYLRDLVEKFDACTVASKEEQNLLASIAPNYKNSHVIPNGIQLENYASINEVAKPNTLIFTGSFGYAVNYHAMQWFLTEIYPRVVAQIPQAELTITGDHKNLPLPDASKIIKTGLVGDVRPLISASWVSIAPLQQGGGTRLKILEAMALRTPVVATTKGAQGLGAEHGKHLLIADTAEDFAAAIIRLFTNEQLRRTLTDQAYEFVRSHYDWATITPQFHDLLDQIVEHHPHSKTKTLS